MTTPKATDSREFCEYVFSAAFCERISSGLVISETRRGRPSDSGTDSFRVSKSNSSAYFVNAIG